MGRILDNLKRILLGVGAPDEVERRLSAVMAPSHPIGVPANWQGDRNEEVQHYKQWTYVAINAIADKVAEQRIRLGIKLSERMVPDNNPMRFLLDRVNDSGDTQSELWYESTLYLLLTGNCYWWVIPNSLGQPAELWVVPSQWIRSVASKTKWIDHWLVSPSGNFGSQAARLRPEEIIHIRRISPVSKIDGYSPLQGGAEWIDTSESINDARWNSFKNGSWPGLMIKLGDTYADPSDSQIARLQDKFLAKFGRTENAGRPLIVKPDMDIQALTLTPKEMDFGMSADQMRDSILSLFRVPKIIAGISEDVNFASANAAMTIFCTNTVQPILNTIAGAVTEQLAPRFNPRIRAFFDECAPNNPELHKEQWETGLKYGVVSPDEYRAYIGLKPLEDDLGKYPARPGTFHPIDQPVVSEEKIEVEEEDDEEEETEEVVKQLLRQRASLPLSSPVNGNGHATTKTNGNGRQESIHKTLNGKSRHESGVS